MTGEMKNEKWETTVNLESDSTAESNARLGCNEPETEENYGVESLWRIQINSIRDQIISGAKDYLEVANLSEHIGADYHGRFLVELVQAVPICHRVLRVKDKGIHSTCCGIVLSSNNLWCEFSLVS